MKRTTIFVPEDLERDLQLYANRDGRPAASLVREALAEYIAHRRDAHVLPSFAGQFASGHSDTAERHDALLFKALVPHEDEVPAAPRRRTPAPVRKPAARRR
jgi:predicted DNA-binding protein